MLDKLLASEQLPKEIDVQVGTIHSFQGDECDIIFAVYNTPPSISSSTEMFLNKKNIINVSISRARDYLFIVMPDDNTENISNLRLIKKVESLIKHTNAWTEFSSPTLEGLMFGDAKYLENNAFSTSHQNVNVYGLPEKLYEVRTEDAAIDVQLHKSVSTSKAEQMLENIIDTDNCKASNDLNENAIPETLREDAIILPFKGAINGRCHLIPYEGKLKNHTIRKTVCMFIALLKNGQKKMISVSVIEEERSIFISKEMYKCYAQSLSSSKEIELRRTFF